MTERDPLALWFIPMAAIVAPAYAADYLTAEQAQRILFPEAKQFVSQPVELTSEQRNQIKALSGVRQRWETQRVWRAEGDAGALLGWFIVDEVIGKHEFITYAAALSPDARVIGIEIMSYRETYGGQVRDAQWRKHFNGKSLADAFKLDQDIPNITGATLSCRNITDGVKRLLALQRVVLSHG
jgi:Na+-translocating ferredoxin:NAD+ oxidoreductase RnfG subunit